MTTIKNGSTLVEIQEIIGLLARCNFINYVNDGGTSMNGDAFSVDIITGGNKKLNK